jgi:hypothetical protein
MRPDTLICYDRASMSRADRARDGADHPDLHGRRSA